MPPEQAQQPRLYDVAGALVVVEEHHQPTVPRDEAQVFDQVRGELVDRREQQPDVGLAAEALREVAAAVLQPRPDLLRWDRVGDRPQAGCDRAHGTETEPDRRGQHQLAGLGRRSGIGQHVVVPLLVLGEPLRKCRVSPP
ncbi:hypothetical protein GCM10023108_21900 [Saccharopolyspora hordei]